MMKQCLDTCNRYVIHCDSNFGKDWNMSRDIKTIKKEILDQFRAMDGEENDVLPKEWLRDEYLPVLDMFERKDFDKAIQQLAKRGVVKYEKGPVPILKLTEMGANLIH